MRVLIVADDRHTAEAIRRALRYAPTCRVLGYISASVLCGPAVCDAAADVVVIDERSTEAETDALVRCIRAAMPLGKLVLLTTDMHPDRLAGASSAGIDAAIARTAAPSSIGLLVREVTAGHVYHTFQRDVPRPEMSDATASLTAREREILMLVAAGMTNLRIADSLYVTEQTVKFHLSNLYRKLGLANRTEASHYAHLHGLVGPPNPDPLRRVAVAA